MEAMHTAIYPGSFDPVTNGHLDVVERALHLFDRIIIAVATNEEKTALFSFEERLELIKEATPQANGRLDFMRFDGLLVDFALEQKASAIVRGLRAISDFEFEFQMALMNRELAPDLETIFLMPNAKYTYLSSRIIREIARLGGDVSSFVPTATEAALKRQFAGNA